MGEDVKITVIATGFRDEMPQRRNRMLAESTLPTRSEPLLPRIEQRPATARFASETPAPAAKEPREVVEADDLPASQPPLLREIATRESGPPRIYLDSASEASTIPVAVMERAEVAESRPELLPVAASVFDDDFFRKPNEELRATGLQNSWPEPAQGRATAPAYDTQKESKASAFAGHATESVPATDELDIPAFLRRSH